MATSPTHSDIPNEQSFDTIYGRAPVDQVRRIGQYNNASAWREGLYSIVYRAHDQTHSDEATAMKASSDWIHYCSADTVALKVTNPQSMTPPHNSRCESRVLHFINVNVQDEHEHAHTLALLDCFEDINPNIGRNLVLVFPFYPLELSELIKRRDLNPSGAKSHVCDLFRALSFLHRYGIIHRDIKPANILLRSPDGPACLADFGIAWMPGDETFEKPDDKITDVGTEQYRPPELLFGDSKYGCALDLWAAGCVVAEVASLGLNLGIKRISDEEAGTDKFEIGYGESLFDSGELGSDLSLIYSHFHSLGTPNEEIWPASRTWIARVFEIS